ncbi:heavy metal-binding domain-containing protein [Emticicia soli]|uniref:Heavy metal-binding domain-containing protein n=1 Tax=Emticicia soli TaxID=2027878 RepID=A0ABW5J943_9BACT
MENCPNCGAKINPNSFFSPNSLLSQKEIDLINYFTEDKIEGYCTNCGSQPFQEALASLNLEIEEIKEKQINALSNSVLCLNLQSPLGWDYDIVNIVTSKATIESNFLRGLTQEINDLFGVESGVIYKRISETEKNCLDMLRIHCLRFGGNAVIGVNISYYEIGEQKSLIMICITGTAIKVKNTSVFPEETRKGVEDFNFYTQKLWELEQIK